MRSLRLQKSPTRDFEEKWGNSPDISKGSPQLGMCKFESSQVSQPVSKPQIMTLKGDKGPRLAGFCNCAPVSQLPNWRTRRPFREKSPGTTADIPVFRRFSPEIGFDLHCVRVAGSISFGSLTRKLLDWEFDPLTAKRKR
jgi:hypothetical protein